MDEASDILMNDLLVVDIEAVLLKKEPQFFFIERTLKQYKMGNYDIKPLLYPADYRQALNVGQYAAFTLTYEKDNVKSLIRQAGITFEVGNLHQFARDDASNESKYLNNELKTFRQELSSNYTVDQMIVSEFQDEYIRIIHDQ